MHRAIEHAEGAIRCYLLIVAAEAERRWRRVSSEIIFRFVTAGLFLVGTGFLTAGIAKYLESVIPLPGGGLMLMGVVILAAAGVAMLARRGLTKGDRDR